MSKKTIVVLVLILFGAIVANAGGAGEGSGGSTQKLELLGYMSLPPSTTQVQTLMRMSEVVNAANVGLDMRVQHSGQLGSDVESVQSCLLGMIDIVGAGTGLYGNLYEPLKIFDIPFLFRDRPHARAVAISDITTNLCKDFEKVTGMIYLFTSENGLREVSSNKPIHSVEDVKGLKIRLPEITTYIETWKSWGAVVFPIVGEEVYTALQTGVVEAQDNAPLWVVSNKIYEVQKNYALINYAWLGMTWSMNKAKYALLSPSQQQAIKTASKKAADFSFQHAQDNESGALQEMEKRGMKINYTPDVESFKRESKTVIENLKKQPWFNQSVYDAISRM
jgi:tripartite ATP-independent transporter DctP family solute receptor